MTVQGALGLAVAVVASACAREGADRVRWVGELGSEAREGTVRLVGNEPFARVVLEPEEGESVVVTGPYRAEVGRLAGARVRLTGRLTAGEPDGSALDASSYEILSVDGDRPTVGELARDEEGYYLREPGGSLRRLSAVSDGLAARVGALVWVVIDEREGAARYGILRDRAR